MHITSLKKKLNKTISVISEDLFHDVLLTDMNGNTITSNRKDLDIGFFNPETNKSIIEIDNLTKFVLYVKQKEEFKESKLNLGIAGILKRFNRKSYFL